MKMIFTLILVIGLFIANTFFSMFSKLGDLLSNFLFNKPIHVEKRINKSNLRSKRVIVSKKRFFKLYKFLK